MDVVSQLIEDLKVLGIRDHYNEAALLYLAATSRRMAQKFSVLLVGASAEGKSMLLNTVVGLFPPEETLAFSFMTKAALFREGDLSNRVIVFNEHFADAELASALRQLVSEGRVRYSLVLEGRLRTLDLRGPITILEATTEAEALDFQNRNRSFALTISASPEELADRCNQMKYRRTLSGLEQQQVREELIAAHQMRQAKLKIGLEVVIPFAMSIRFRSPHAHGLRFFQSFLNLIESIAYLDQENRPVRKRASGSEYIEATTHDYREAYNLIRGVKVETGSELLPDDAVALLKDLKAVSRFAGPEPFRRDEILMKVSGWTLKPLRRLLPILERNDLLLRGKKGTHGAITYHLSNFARELDPTKDLVDACNSLPPPDEL